MIICTPDEELHRINGLSSYILNLFSINWIDSIELANVPNLYDDCEIIWILFDLPISFFQIMLNLDNQDIFL